MLKNVLISLTVVIFIGSGILVTLIVKQVKGSHPPAPSTNGVITNQGSSVVESDLPRDVFPKELLDDKDQDGLSAEEELSLGTSDLETDTDGDGIDDFTEVKTLLTNPTTLDTDGDGIADYVEVLQGTDPTKK